MIRILTLDTWINSSITYVSTWNKKVLNPISLNKLGTTNLMCEIKVGLFKITRSLGSILSTLSILWSSNSNFIANASSKMLLSWIVSVLGVCCYDSSKFLRIPELFVCLWSPKFHWIFDSLIVSPKPLTFGYENLTPLLFLWTCSWEYLTFGWHSLTNYQKLWIHGLIWG